MEHLKRLEELILLLTTHTTLQRYISPKDREVIVRRIEGEGVTFLSKVLPRLDKYLLTRLSCSENSSTSGAVSDDQKSMTQDCILGDSTSQPIAPGRENSCPQLPVPASPPAGSAVLGFKNQRGCAYPRFLRKAWENILDKDGNPLPISMIDAEAVACIRQMSHLFYKLEMPYTEHQEQEVINAFVSAESDLRALQIYANTDTCRLLKRASTIVHCLLGSVDPKDIIPKHGSGSSACGTKPHERYSTFRFIPRLNREFPYAEYFFYNQTHVADEADKLLEAEVCDPPAKVVFVPKDSRGPRLISEEPREFMYIQQGLMKAMYDRVRELPTVASMLDFTEQTRNQEMARTSSIDGKYATLDLKEASDRVSMDLVSQLFPENWVRALTASRSKSTVLPNGMKVPFSKFAPMGSACCFPVEAICFWAIALAACEVDRDYIRRLFADRKGRKRPLPKHLRFSKTDLRISVFGDDIIVPTENALCVFRALEAVGLIVNSDKSFWTGNFRESCGGDYFNGHNVTPIRCKAIPDDSKRARHRTCELFNNLIRKYGYENIGLALQLLFESWYGPVPISSRWKKNSPTMEKTQSGLYLIGPYTDVPTAYRTRFHTSKDPTKGSLHRREYRVPCIVGIDQKIDADSWSHVLRKNCQKLNLIDVTRVALPKRYRIKYRWIEL